ncbi:MAG: leucine-rich repeat domain-containing protein, partial [Clostridia bacterium]|nr:leucine-rich repeat domain-containing protein [Clostridia bacterium]
MNYKTNESYRTDRVYHRYYSGMRGVDFSADAASVSVKRFADMQNMWRDWKGEDGAVEAFPGYRLLNVFPGAIYGIHRQKAGGKQYILVHSGENLYRFAAGDRDRPHLLAALAPVATGLPLSRSTSFSVGETTYLLTGSGILQIDPAGVCTDALTRAYVPVTYQNGEPYEQRNILTDKIRHVFDADGILDPKRVTEGLTFKGEDSVNRTCFVSGNGEVADAGRIVVPETAVIGGEKYTVTGVAPNGFQNFGKLISVWLPETVRMIGGYAFAGCNALSSVRLPDSLTHIFRRAFQDCLMLPELYLGKNVTYIDEDILSGCLSIRRVCYDGTAAEYAAIAGDGVPVPSATLTVEYDTPVPEDRACVLRMPLFDPVTGVSGVKVDGTGVTTSNQPLLGTVLRYDATVIDGLIPYVDLYAADRTALSGRQITIEADASSTGFSAPFHRTPFGKTTLVSGADALKGCKAVAK